MKIISNNIENIYYGTTTLYIIIFGFFCVKLKVYMLIVSLSIKSSYIVQLYKWKLIIILKNMKNAQILLNLLKEKILNNIYWALKYFYKCL